MDSVLEVVMTNEKAVWEANKAYFTQGEVQAMQEIDSNTKQSHAENESLSRQYIAAETKGRKLDLQGREV